ncbi:MAG TPA: hypothetical protein VEK57_21170, partial [Thermoanaerobaculia bacterium]|nr:hypothetical protein [Thermoanaerobaculia bacterium]
MLRLLMLVRAAIVSVALPYHVCALSFSCPLTCFEPPLAGRHLQLPGREFVPAASPSRLSHMEVIRSLKFLGDPQCEHAPLFDPGLAVCNQALCIQLLPSTPFDGVGF